MIDTKDFYDYMINKGLDFYVGVPDSLLKDLCAYIKKNTDQTHNITAANEGNAIGIASGYHIATGKFPVVYMQNSGIGNAINPLLSLADEEVYKIPMLLIIGWRGEPNTKDEPQHKKQGKVTKALLDAAGIDYIILDNENEGHWKKQVDGIIDYLNHQGKSIALIVKKDSFSKYELEKAESKYTIVREQALECILSSISDKDIIVSTTGKTSREIFELREKSSSGHANDFLTVGSMGHTSSIAFGMSIGTDKNIYCIDGDGSFLMHMGGLAISASIAKKNFKYILINNGAHESVGGQPTIAFDINIKEIIKNMGFDHVYVASTLKDINLNMKKMASNPELSALIINTKQGSRKDLGRPTLTPEQNKLDLMKKLSKTKIKL